MFLKLSFALLNVLVFGIAQDDRQIKIYSDLENMTILFSDPFSNNEDYIIYPYNKIIISNSARPNHTTLTYISTHTDEDWAEMIFYNKVSKSIFKINIVCELNIKPYRLTSFANISKLQNHESVTLTMDSICKSESKRDYDTIRFRQYVYTIIILVVFQFIMFNCKYIAK